LRAQPPMHEPLLIPDGLEGPGAALDENAQQEWPTKGAETRLRVGRAIRVAGGRWSFEQREDEPREQIRLEQCIDVDKGAQVPAVSNVSRRWVELVGTAHE